MKIDSAALPSSAASAGRAGVDPQAKTELTDAADPASTSADPKGSAASAGEGPGKPLFATVLASASAPLQNKVKSSLPIGGAPTFTLGQDVDKSAITGDGKKKGAPKAGAQTQKKGAASEAEMDGQAGAVPMLPIAERPLPAIPLTLPSFETGASLTGTDAELAGGLAEQAAAGAMLSGAALLPAGAHGELGGLDHVALSLEASAGIDARNGFAATSGVHRTAKAIAEDQSRIGVSSSESARTYAAIAKATSTTVTSMIHAAAASTPPQARKTETSAAHASGPEPKVEGAPRNTATPTNDARGGDDASGNDGGRNQSQQEQRAQATATKEEGKTAEVSAAPTAAAAHASFSLPLPTHVGTTTTTSPVTKAAEVQAAFAEDLMSGVERAAASGRTDFEVRAFDGTRVAINVQMKDDKVHVGFAFDAKHSAAEATVRATVGNLETRMSERGLSTVVSFGTLQRTPQHAAVTATTSSGAGSNATANGQGQGGKNNGDPRGEPQLAEITELAPRSRQADARNGGSGKAPAPTPNGRGGWVA